MLLGIFADSHDHLDYLRRTVEVFNAAQVEHALFAGDLVSTFCTPILRKLTCKITACYGDNEGNKEGLQAGFSILGTLAEAPLAWTSPDGLRFVIVHMERQLRDYEAEFDVCIYAHTHKPRIARDDQGRLFLNPGEVSGWTFQRPTVMLFDTATREARIVELSEQVSQNDEARMTNDQ
jgi:putative phosphoesterase